MFDLPSRNFGICGALIRQFLVGAVIGCLSVHYIQSLKSFFFMWLKSFSGIGLQLQLFYATNAILLVL